MTKKQVHLRGCFKYFSIDLQHIINFSGKSVGKFIELNIKSYTVFLSVHHSSITYRIAVLPTQQFHPSAFTPAVFRESVIFTTKNISIAFSDSSINICCLINSRSLAAIFFRSFTRCMCRSTYISSSFSRLKLVFHSAKC